MNCKKVAHPSTCLLTTAEILKFYLSRIIVLPLGQDVTEQYVCVFIELWHA